MNDITRAVIGAVTFGWLTNRRATEPPHQDDDPLTPAELDQLRDEFAAALAHLRRASDALDQAERSPHYDRYDLD